MSVMLTEKAAIEVKKIIADQKLDPATVLRVGVAGGGCSGLSYKLDFVPDVSERDKVFEQDGVRVAVDPKSFLYLNGMELDYSGGLNGKGFTFQNPNAKKSCGCGNSFSA